jgi:integrase
MVFKESRFGMDPKEYPLVTTMEFRNCWRADVYAHGQKIKSKSGFATQKEAQKWHDEFLKIYMTQNENSVKKVRQTYFFDEVLKKFEELHLPTVRKSTWMRYQSDLKYRILPFFQYYRLDDIDQFLVEKFKIEIMAQLSPKSVNNCLGLLKTIFRKAVEWKMIPDSPAEYVSIQKIPQIKYGWWENKSDIALFLAVAKSDRYYLAYRLALDLGMRLGEIIGLSKGDVNMNRCQIHIHRQWIDKEKKYGPTKHGKERYIAFERSSELYMLLEEALGRDSDNEIIFETPSKKRLNARKLSNYHFQRVISTSGVPRIRFHDLRHTFASWFMIVTDNIWDLKKILGHADIQTTQRYAHLSSKQQVAPNFGWEESSLKN